MATLPKSEFLSTESVATGKPRTVPAGQFKAKCLQLLDEVAETREPIVVTKFGKPVAMVLPMPARQSLFGAMKGTVTIVGDIISPIEGVWDLRELADEER